MAALPTEIGRKIRAPADERPGVNTYTRAWGLRAAPHVNPALVTGLGSHLDVRRVCAWSGNRSALLAKGVDVLVATPGRLLDFLEDATDRCEDVANVLEGVMVKHG